MYENLLADVPTDLWIGGTWRKASDDARFDVIDPATEKLITLENGKALSDSRGEVAYAAEFFRWYAEEAVRNIGEVSRAPSSGARIFVHHRPAGVAVLVTPWNFPAAMATRK